jgi:WhiB family transcriptional regulator, redox-sensing transcriptional regulator
MDMERANWRDDAACLHTDPDLFFPIGTAGSALRQVDVDEAKRICRTCPVRSPCLTWALDQGSSSGIWGGTTEDERRALRRAAIPHGRRRAGSVTLPGRKGG